MFKSTFAILFLCLAFSSQGMMSVDPTKPLFGGSSSKQATKRTPLVLQSIMEVGEHRKVIINGKVLKLGDKISSYKVTAITSKTVVLNSAQQRLELSLFSSAVTK